jgi:drug/metabolite transporter (DMT)-like permease
MSIHTFLFYDIIILVIDVKMVYNFIYLVSVLTIIVVFIVFKDRSTSLEWLLSIVLLIMTAIFTYMNRRQRRE